MANVTRTIFLKLVPRKEVAGDFKGIPFSSFVKFSAEGATKEGGMVLLDIRSRGKKVGRIMIDWPTAESRRPPRRGLNYMVAEGKIDHVEPAGRMTFRTVDLIVEAMKNADWLVYGYDPDEDRKKTNARFEEWIDENL